MTKKINTVQDLHDLFTGKEIMIVGEHEWRGTITKYVEIVSIDGKKNSTNR